MGMDTNDLDTRDEDKAKTEGRLEEFWDDDMCCPDCGCKVTYQIEED